jgi:hypothetical protein
VLEVRADRANEACPLALQRVMRPGGGGDVVRFVYDQEIELARMACVRWQDIPHGAKPLATLDPVHRGDEPWMGGPRVGMDATFAPQLFDISGIDHAELKAELFQHLDTPLLLERGWADDQYGTGTVPQQHLLDDQPSLDGLAQADVVGDEQIDACHVDGANQRVELEVLDADATSERCLQETSIGIGGGAPTDGIEECFERVRVVLPGNGGQACALDDLCARFDLPDDLQFLAETIFVDG